MAALLRICSFEEKFSKNFLIESETVKNYQFSLKPLVFEEKQSANCEFDENRSVFLQFFYKLILKLVPGPVDT